MEEEYSGEVIVLHLSNGYTLRSAGNMYELGDYVRFCDPQGREVLYYDAAEWSPECRECGEQTMGIILDIIKNPAKLITFQLKQREGRNE